MEYVIRYIELKSGFHDDGPAWIGKVRLSKSEQTVYFNEKTFQRCRGIQGNYFDIETNEEYWISGVKKDGTNRHKCGHGKILMDRSIVKEYLDLMNQVSLDKNKFELI